MYFYRDKVENMWSTYFINKDDFGRPWCVYKLYYFTWFWIGLICDGDGFSTMMIGGFWSCCCFCFTRAFCVWKVRILAAFSFSRSCRAWTDDKCVLLINLLMKTQVSIICIICTNRNEKGQKWTKTRPGI